MATRRESLTSFRAGTAGVTALVGLMLFTACGKRRAGASSEGDCSDGKECMDEAMALVRTSTKDHAEQRGAKAVVLLQKACDLAVDRSCSTLAFWLDDGGLVPTDLPRAVRLYERGCALKDATACDQLVELYRKGHGVPKDPALESKYRDLRCDYADSMTASTFCSDERLAKDTCAKQPDGEACQFYRQRIADEARREAERTAWKSRQGSGEEIRLEDLGTIGRPDEATPPRHHSKNHRPRSSTPP